MPFPSYHVPDLFRPLTRCACLLDPHKRQGIIAIYMSINDSDFEARIGPRDVLPPLYAYQNNMISLHARLQSFGTLLTQATSVTNAAQVSDLVATATRRLEFIRQWYEQLDLVRRLKAQLEVTTRQRGRVQQRTRGVSLGAQQRRLGRGRAAVDALVVERRDHAEPAARAGTLVEQLEEPQPTPADGVMDEWWCWEWRVRSFGVVELQQLQLDADG